MLFAESLRSVNRGLAGHGAAEGLRRYYFDYIDADVENAIAFEHQGIAFIVYRDHHSVGVSPLGYVLAPKQRHSDIETIRFIGHSQGSGSARPPPHHDHADL
jgi:hypothetical protein